MPNSLEEQLTTLARSIRIEPVPITPPASIPIFRVRLLPPAGGGMTITELITKTVIEQGDLELDWVSKDVRFMNTDITNPMVVGGMPIADLLTLNIANVTEGRPSPPGVPGVVAKLKGKVPIPVQVTKPAENPVPIRVDARLRILDEQGMVSDVTWTLDPDGTPIRGTGGEIIPSSGHALDTLELVFQPAFVELTSAPTLIIRRFIHASVRLESNTGVSSDWIDLPPLTISFPAIPVPTILFLFMEPQYGDRILIAVPPGSPLSDEATVNSALSILITTMATLTGSLPAGHPLPTLLSLMTTRLPDLITRISSTTAIQGWGEKVLVRQFDSISHLASIAFYEGFFGFIGRLTAEDTMSSLVFIGPPHRRVACFNAQNFEMQEGRMEVTIGPELIVEVPTLASASPSSNPPGQVTVVMPPAGGVLVHRTVFSNEFSSLRFEWGV